MHFNIPNRSIIKIERNGDKDDASPLNYLQKLITADIRHLGSNADTVCVYSALLDSKGRFIFDFFIHTGIQGADISPNPNNILYIEIHSNWSKNLIEALEQYKLRTKIIFNILDNTTAQIKDINSFFKNFKLGRNSFSERILRQDTQEVLPEPSQQIPEEIYDFIRIVNTIPDGARDLQQYKSVILDFAFDTFSAVSTDKGCYLGQELMTRTKHTGAIRKKLFCIIPEGITEQGSSIIKELFCKITQGSESVFASYSQCETISKILDNSPPPTLKLNILDSTSATELDKQGISHSAPPPAPPPAVASFAAIIQNNKKVGILLSSVGNIVFLAQLKFHDIDFTQPLTVNDQNFTVVSPLESQEAQEPSV